jgi:hypothetical protein
LSYDRKIEQVCTHQVVEEALFLSEDRVTVRPLRPIASVQSVKVRYNSLLDVPSAGVGTSAVVKGSLPGPFDIQSGVNDTLVLSVDGRPDQTLTVPAGNQLTATQVASALNAQTQNIRFGQTKKGQLQGSSRATGPSARIQVKSTSTVAETLGLTEGRVYRGQQVMPGWSLIQDPNTLNDRPTRLIIFDDRIEGTNDYFEINYSTVRQECRRCGGSGVENDWRYDRRGEVIKVQNTDLLVQEVLKITYTEKGSNPFHEWYGTSILDGIGKKLSDRGIVQNMIVTDIREAFKRWQSIKKQQEETVGQFVSDEEFPFRLLLVNLEQDDNDPTVIFVNALVQSRSSQPIQVSRGLKLPLPFDLLGSSVQDSLLRAEEAKALQPYR